MPRPKNNLTDMEIDEISTVDKAANQHSRFVIAKRAPEEEEMPKLYNQEGQPLDEDQLEFGDIVYDDTGAAYEYVENEVEDTKQDEDKDEPVPELAGVGKSAFFEKSAPKTGSFSASVMEELSKAFSDKDRDAVIAKALGRVEELEKAQREATEIAKSERDLRLTREYISKAAEYNLPIPADQLGPVLYRMAESMSFDDCKVIARATRAAATTPMSTRRSRPTPTTPSGSPRTSTLSQPSIRCSTRIRTPTTSTCARSRPGRRGSSSWPTKRAYGRSR